MSTNKSNIGKVRKTDLNKLSKLEEQILELTKQKEEQEKDLANKLGVYFLNELNISEVGTVEEIYELIDEVINKFHKSINTESESNSIYTDKISNDNNNENQEDNENNQNQNE